MQYQIIHGDCLERLSDVADGSVDMILADLPYGTTACKWDTVIPFDPLWRELHRILKKKAAVLMFASQPFAAALGASCLKDLRYSWIWKKAKPTNFVNAKRMPLKGFEEILTFYRELPTYNPQGLTRVDKSRKNTGTQSRGSLKANGDVSAQGFFQGGGYRQEYTNYPRGILEYPQEVISHHPTQKPVALLEYLIRTYTNKGDTVLDPTMGSGSTGVAALKCGRKFIGIEKDADYVWIAEKRLKYEAELHAAIRAPMPGATP